MAGSDAGKNPDLFLAHRDLIERVIGFVSRRQRLSPSEADEFASEVSLHLIDHDHAVLRAFQGRSSLQTYLLTVIIRCYRDWRNAEWGKWRPSAEARRLGPLAMRLETLIVRDRLTCDQAEEMLRTAHGFTGTRQTIEAMAARFPSRPGRAFVTDEVLEERPAPTRADAGLAGSRAEGVARRASDALGVAVRALPPQDRLVLRLRFGSDVRIVDIARMIGVEQKPLYRRIERLLKQLRGALEAAGVTAADAEDAIRYGGFDNFEERDTNAGKKPAEVRPTDRDERAPVASERVP